MAVPSKGHKFTDGLTCDAEGNLYFSDVAGGTTINRLGYDGKLTVVVKDALYQRNALALMEGFTLAREAVLDALLRLI